MFLQDNFLGKAAKERRQQRRQARQERRKQRQALRMRKREARAVRLEAKAQNEVLDNAAKQSQVQLTQQLAQGELIQDQNQNTGLVGNVSNQQRNTLLIIGGVFIFLIIGVVIFMMTKKN
jgi:hypothetical protein